MWSFGCLNHDSFFVLHVPAVPVDSVRLCSHELSSTHGGHRREGEGGEGLGGLIAQAIGACGPAAAAPAADGGPPPEEAEVGAAQFFSAVLLTGGSSLLDGLKQRLERELNARSNGAPVKVIAESGRRHAAWRGASILAELYAFSEVHDFDSGFSIPWITSEAYSRDGPEALRDRRYQNLFN